MLNLSNPVLKKIGARAPCFIRSQYFHFRGTGNWPNLYYPKTINELITSRKVFIRPNSSLGKLLIRTANKYTMREYVRSLLGDDYLPSLYAVYDDLGHLRKGSLPCPSVVKVAHGSGSNVFIHDGTSRRLTENEYLSIENWFSEEFRSLSGEWWYDLGPRLVVVEEFLDDGTAASPPDYKFFVCRGEVAMIQMDYNRHVDHRRNLYDTSWRRIECNLKYPGGTEQPVPKQFSKMLDIASTLGSSFDFVRVDLYNFRNRIFVGELTHAPGAGWESFSAPWVDQWLFKQYVKRNGTSWRQKLNRD